MTAPAPFDRLVAKETALGSLREIPTPSEHIGVTQIAPFENVDSDDVIFDFLEDNLTEGLAPARAQDAEAELAQKDDFALTSGRARIIDWSLKNTYDASKVMAYKDALRVRQALQGQNAVTIQNAGAFDRPVVEFRNKIARDDAWRRKRLDNRLEWLVMTGFETSKLAYADGKINFAIDYKRPAGQQDVAVGTTWDNAAADPINDVLAMNRYMFDTYGMEMKEAYLSKYILRDLFKLDKFRAAATVGLLVPAGAVAGNQVPYLNPQWNSEAAIRILEEATGVKFIPYDGIYRSRSLGSTAFTNVRYTSSKKVIFKPSAADLAQVDPDGMGFAKTLTSPHPEGNWASGFYEWEKDRTDPWGTDRGTGIKAFPIFPFMKYSYVMKVLP